MDESGEHDVKFVEARKDAAEAFEPAEESLDLVATAIHRPIILPRGKSIGVGWHNDGKPKIQSQLAGFVAFVSPVHNQMTTGGRYAESFEQLASLRRISGLTRREGKTYGAPSIRGNQMNLGAPASARFSDGLRPVFFKAPVPSGCTLTIVLSKETASSLMRMICSC